MGTPSWLKKIGSTLKAVATGAAAIFTPGLVGGAIGGTDASPTAVAAEASVAAQGASGDADLGKGASVFADLFKKENVVKLVIFGVLAFVIFKAARKL